MQTARHGQRERLRADLSPLPWQLHRLIISDSPSFVSQTHLKKGKKKKKQSKPKQVGDVSGGGDGE